MNTLSLPIKAIIKETNEAITIVFERPQNAPAYKAGQFLTLLLSIEGEALRRAYSLCSSPTLDQDWAVTVKRVPQGKVSNYLNDHAKAGDTMEVLPPAGVFTTQISPKNKRHLILFAGGSGITPMMSILTSVLAEEPKTTVSLVYANRNEASIIFREKIQQLQQKYPKNFNVVHVLEEPPTQDWKGFKGMLNPDMVRDILKMLPKFVFNPTEYMMCGPNGMMEQVTLAFEKLKIAKDKLKKEVFTSDLEKKTTTTSPETLSGGNKRVTIKYAGETHEFEVAPTQTILEAAMKMDIDLPYSCQSGMCTACMGKCLSGKVKLDEEDALTPKELEQGYVLTCVGHPITDDVVIQID
ncbi:MAG: ferredoxin--NADP reductase [Cytophagales bacterium]|nr:MAG: ferredoxin--NADP reductase [Cytophagales bacterium]